ncbi:MAG: dockerin type I repeat-containing protein [Planctomycetes bacterium]|nr:dockerin type I repeat-containing protein [Planctomycetota bacterium]
MSVPQIPAATLDAAQVSAVAPSVARSAHMKAAAASPPASPPTPTVYGDVNGDGVFNDDDASALLGYLFGTGGETPAGLANADANGDGGVDISDAVQLLNSLRGQGPYGLQGRTVKQAPIQTNLPNSAGSI